MAYDAHPSMMHVRFNYAWHGKVHKQVLQVKWISICNELHIDETPHYNYLIDSRYLQDKINCLLTWQEVKQEQTTYLDILNEAGR